METWVTQARASAGCFAWLSSLPAVPLLLIRVQVVASRHQFQLSLRTWHAVNSHVRYANTPCLTQVTDVRPCSRGGMQLTALLDESASMLSHDNRARDFYRSTYEARYQAVKSRDGAWRIARITVVGEGSAADQS